MRHLKTYKESQLPVSRFSNEMPEVLPDDVVQEIKDICLELSDEGYKVDVNLYNIPVVDKSTNDKYPFTNGFTKKDYPGTGIKLSDNKNNNNFSYLGTDYSQYVEQSNIFDRIFEEVLGRIKDYVEPMGYSIIHDSEWDAHVIYFVKRETNESLKSYADYFVDRKLPSTYKESRVDLPQEIINELNDICLELNDEGFYTKIYPTSVGLNPIMRRSITALTISVNEEEDKYFDFMNIREVVDRIVDYMDQVGYDCIPNRNYKELVNAKYGGSSITAYYLCFAKK